MAETIQNTSTQAPVSTPTAQATPTVNAGGSSGLFGALINSTLGAGLSYVFTKALAKKQHKYNKELADHQNQINIQNWNMQNDYNSPAAQRARLEKAGLNPALAYGGAGNTGNAQPIHAYQQQGVDYAQSLLSVQQIGQLAQNFENLQSLQLDNAKKREELPFAGATAKAILDNYIAELDNKKANTQLTKGQYRKVLKEIEKIDVDIEQVRTSIEDMLNQINIRTAQNKREEELQPLRAALLQAQEVLTLEQEKDLKEMRPYKKKQINSQIEVNDANVTSINLRNFMQNWENGYTQRHGVQPSQNVWTTLLNGIMSGQEGFTGLSMLDYSNPSKIFRKWFEMSTGRPFKGGKDKNNDAYRWHGQGTRYEYPSKGAR